VSEPAAILEHALGLAEGRQAEAVYTARDASLTRFAGSHIHQNVSEHDASVRFRVMDEGRTGVAGTNRLDPEGLREMVERAMAVCRHARANPTAVGLADPGVGTADSELGFVTATADSPPELRAEGARSVIEAARDGHLTASGAFSTESGTLAVANSTGLYSRHASTQAKLLTVMTAPDGASGYAQATSADVNAIDASAVGQEAAGKASRSSDPIDLPPGEYPVVLEEYAVATILEYLSWTSFSALALEERRTFMELGTQVMGRNVSIWDDGQDPSGMPAAIDYEGVAKRRVDLISEGVATAFVHDTATARRAGVQSTGHGLPAPNTFGPLAWNLFMAPGSGSKDGMVAGIERGIWVTRFHYVNIVHPRRAVLTGMTKDGTFLIEDGRITRPVRNLRFTQAIPEAFQRISAISAETRLVAPEYSGVMARVPALRIDNFTFTGATAAEAEG
jgi:predicted Zn-dependent protease